MRRSPRSRLLARLRRLQDAVGRTLLADATAEAARTPLLFSANTLLANGVGAALASAGAGLGWSAHNYFFVAAGMQVALAPAALLLYVRTLESEASGGAGASDQEEVVEERAHERDDCAMLSSVQTHAESSSTVAASVRVVART